MYKEKTYLHDENLAKNFTEESLKCEFHCVLQFMTEAGPGFKRGIKNTEQWPKKLEERMSNFLQ